MKREKLEKPLGVRLPTGLADALENVAAAQLSSAQALLRAAAKAIVECQARHGSVPADMEIVQAKHAARREEAPAYTETMARTPVDETAEEVAEQVLATVRAHPLFADKHVQPYFLPALRRALLRRLDGAASGLAPPGFIQDSLAQLRREELAASQPKKKTLRQ